MATATSEKTTMNQVGEQRYSVNVEANRPNEIRAIMLADGKWHTTKDCELIQYAISESNSPIHPAKLYPYLKFRDDVSNKWVKVPFSQVLAFDTRD